MYRTIDLYSIMTLSEKNGLEHENLTSSFFLNNRLQFDVRRFVTVAGKLAILIF
jgi:hypothetical protein